VTNADDTSLAAFTENRTRQFNVERGAVNHQSALQHQFR